MAQIKPKSALVVIDVQNDMFNEQNPAADGERLLETIAALIAKARAAGAAVIYVQHEEGEGGPLQRGTKAWEIHPAVAPAPGETVVHKRTPDSFHKTTLQDELGRIGANRLVLTGLQTEMCVDTTCRRAFSLGYDVVLAADAHGTWPSSGLSAQQIIRHHNQTLRWFADVKEAEAISF